MAAIDASPSAAPEEEAAAEASAASSPGSRAAANPFLGDPGLFDPGAAPAAELAPAPALGPEPLWSPERTAVILRGQGAITHSLIGVADTDWVWQDAELRAAAEPLAGVLNKFPVTRAAAAVGDEIALAEALIAYSTRSIRERQEELARRRAGAREVPVTGQPADAPLEPVAPTAPTEQPAPDTTTTWEVR